MRSTVRFLLVTTMCSLGSATTTRGDITFLSQAFEKQYNVTVSSKRLADTAAWKGDAQNPPVSSRRAIQLAEPIKQKFVKNTKEWHWHLVSVALMPDDPENATRWFWLITYEAFPSGGMTGPSPELRAVVLMDGSVIEPVIVRAPSQGENGRGTGRMGFRRDCGDPANPRNRDDGQTNPKK